MYALVEILGKQYKAVEGETVQVDYISQNEAGSSLSMPPFSPLWMRTMQRLAPPPM